MKWDARQGEQIKTSKLTADKVREIRRLAAEGVSQIDLAAQFTVSTTTISDVVTRKTWWHVK